MEEIKTSFWIERYGNGNGSWETPFFSLLRALIIGRMDPKREGTTTWVNSSFLPSQRVPINVSSNFLKKIMGISEI